MKYAEAGVNIELGDDASGMLYEAARKTFEFRKGYIGEIVAPFDDFSGLRVVNVGKLPDDAVMGVGFDGVGTKVEIAQRMGDHSTIAFDLLAMVCDDAIVRGAEPVLVGSVLDVNSLDSGVEYVRQLANGYFEAARAANVAIINGEIAEIGKFVSGYGKFAYNWSASVTWFACRNKLFTGNEIKVGDSVVVLQEKGFRSNGFSLIRKVFREKLGDDWHNLDFKGDKLGNQVLLPSTIYSKAIIRLHGGFQTEGCCEIHGVAHITGGGLPEKIGRVLRPTGYGAELEKLFEPCAAMHYCQEIGGVADREAYRTWNMGQGLAVITPEPEKVINEAKKFGLSGRVAGKVIDNPEIIITSKGYFSNGKKLIFR